MKTKSALFLSAALTTFVLAVLASLVSAFNSTKTATAAVAASPTQQVVVTDALPTQAIPTATQPTQVGPEQAASIAAQYLKKSDVYSVESSTIQGTNAYKVIFSSGDVVFVGLDGSVITTTKLPPVTVNIVPTVAPKHHGGHGGGGKGSGGGNGGDDGGND